MNRLFYGAAGLLLALSLTAMIPNASCSLKKFNQTAACPKGCDSTGDIECPKFGNGKRKAFDEMSVEEVQNLKIEEMQKYVHNMSDKFWGTGQKFLSFKKIKDLPCKQLKVYAHYVHNLVTKRLENLIKEGHKIFGSKLKEKKISRDDLMKEMELKAVKNQKLISREDWEKAYKKLPNTPKYNNTGLSPGKVFRLAKTFHTIISEENYAALKESNADHLSSIAMEARLEAIRQSKTAAGEYFKSHQDELKELYSHLHKHGEMNMKAYDGNGNEMKMENGETMRKPQHLAHKCKHFCASCCDNGCSEKACRDGRDLVG